MQKLQLLGKFCPGSNHDFKTISQVIKNNLSADLVKNKYSKVLQAASNQKNYLGFFSSKQGVSTPKHPAHKHLHLKVRGRQTFMTRFKKFINCINCRRGYLAFFKFKWFCTSGVYQVIANVHQPTPAGFIRALRKAVQYRLGNGLRPVVQNHLNLKFT